MPRTAAAVVRAVFGFVAFVENDDGDDTGESENDIAALMPP